MVAGLVEYAVVVSSSGPGIGVDVCGAEFGPVVDLGCSVATQGNSSASDPKRKRGKEGGKKGRRTPSSHTRQPGIQGPMSS
jgi:hypothetical protein